jgi:hypothetical protein
MDYAVNRLGATTSTDRLMRENYARGLYEGEEYQYWQKVSALKEKLDLLSRLPEPAIERVVRTLLDLARPDFDVLFQLLNNLCEDEQRRFWITYPETDENACDIREDLGQEGIEVKIAFPMSDKTALVLQYHDESRGVYKMMDKRL